MAMDEGPASDKEWMASSDLSTLMEADKIKKDKSRYGAAIGYAKKMRADLVDKNEALNSVAGASVLRSSLDGDSDDGY